MSDLTEEILEVKRESKLTQEKERQLVGKESSPWAFDNEPLAIFDDFFCPVSDKPISTMVSEYKAQHLTTNVLNIMGGPQILRELEPTRGVAVRLADTRTEEQINQDIDKDIYVVEGDVLTHHLWKKIPSDQSFIFSMPQGALYSIPIAQDIYYYLLNESWKKLREGGTMFIQCPKDSKNLLYTWLPVLNRNQGIYARCSQSSSRGLDYMALKVVKSTGYPTALPTI